MAREKQNLALFNDILGFTSNDVPAYSNGDNDFISFEGFYIHGLFTGYKWQCVEFARRWLLLRKSCTFEKIGTAAAMWEALSYIERVIDGQRFCVKTYPNGSPCKPRCDTFLLYSRNEKSPYGHIAVICDVQEDFIRITEQNHLFYYWSSDYAREIKIDYRDGLYYIEDGINVMGWMEIDNHDQLKPLDAYSVDCILEKYRQQKPLCESQLCFIHSKITNDNSLSHCINRQQEEVSINSISDNICYFQANEDFLICISTKTNDFYQLIIEVANEIIHNDELLRFLDIPKQFWFRIRQSWISEHKFDFLDHLKFQFNGKNLKLCNYVIKDRLRVFLSAIEQDKIIRSMGRSNRITSSFQLHHRLIRYWKRYDIQSTIHILIDNDDNDPETINYMKNVITEAGLHIEVCRWPNEFYWKNSMIVDKDDKIVKIVWKLWNWEKMFRGFRDASTDSNEETQWQSVSNEHPSVFDILLNKNIRVIEPLWKSIIHHEEFLSILCRKLPCYSNTKQYESVLSKDLKYVPSINYSMDKEHINLVPYYNAKENINSQYISPEVTREKDSKYLTQTIISWMICGFCSGFCITETIDHSVDEEKTKTYSCVI